MPNDSASSNGSSKAFSTSSFSVSDELLEIAALTTLIGSLTAEYLALGAQGLVGLSWACMSAFGILPIVRTFIVGASPDWLRETLGVRAAQSDSSLGVKLDLTSDLRGASRLKREGNDPKGIMCKSVSGALSCRLGTE